MKAKCQKKNELNTSKYNKMVLVYSHKDFFPYFTK